MPDPTPTSAPAPPPALRTPGRSPRWLAALGKPFRRAYRWYYYATRPVQIMLVVVLIAILVVGSYFGTKFLQGRAAAQEIAAAQKEYHEAGQRADLEGMTAALDKVLKVSPGNPDATRKKAAIQALSADADDPDTAAVLMNIHLKHDRLAEADREAQKVLAKYTTDWRSICVRAHYAFAGKKDPAEARKLVDSLPAPEDPNARLDLGGLLYALRLHELVGRDASGLRSLIVRRLLPHLRGAVAAAAPPGVKAQLLESYLEPFTDPGNANELSGYWADVTRLCDSGVTEAAESGDAAALIRYGTIGQRLRRQALPAIARQVKLPADELASREKEIDALTRRAWDEARKKAPDRYEPYIGLAEAEPDPAKAVEILQDGLTRCGNQLALLDRFTLLAGRVADPVDAAQKALAAALAAKTDPDKWFICARSARVADRKVVGYKPAPGELVGRPVTGVELAVDACKEALRLKPNHADAVLYLAALQIEAGDGLSARDTLLALGNDFVFSHPLAAQRYAQGMVEGAPVEMLREKFDEVLTRAPRNRPPVVPFNFLAGALVARVSPDKAPRVAAEVAALADKMKAEWPGDPYAALIRAQALFRKAELTDPPWNRDAAEAALRAYSDLPSELRDQAGVAVSTACLQLRGLGDEFAALRTLSRLNGAETTPLLNAAQWEVVAAVWVANNKPQDAINLLAQVCTYPNEIRRTPGGTPGCWITMARALLAVRNRTTAREYLAQADNWPAPLTAAERAELSALKFKLQTEQP
jgi:hypothetical protein